MGSSRNEMPPWRVMSGFVREQDHVVGVFGLARPDLLAVDDQVVAVANRAVLSDARSDPASGSEKPWHHTMSPRRMRGRNSCFCSSVPHCNSVGPTRISPSDDTRIGARPRRTPRRAPPTRRPTARGRRTPPATTRRSSRPRTSPVPGFGPGGTAGSRCSSSQARTSDRNASTSGGYVTCIRASP